MSSSVAKRLKQLEESEKDIIEVIQCAASAIEELSKDTPSEEVITSKTAHFLKMLEEIERKLLEQIHYLSQVTTSQQHEGSVYAIEKSFDLAFWKTQIIKKRVQAIKMISHDQ